MKKVLIVGTTSNAGGIETFVLNLLRIQAVKKEYQFTVLDSTQSEIAYLEEFKNLGVNILKIPYPVGFFSVFRRNRFANNILRDNKYDIIHIQANNLNTSFWVKSAKKNNIEKIIFHSHNTSLGEMNFFKKTVLEILMPFQRFYLSNIRGVKRLACSKNAGRWMFSDGDFTIIPNGVNTNDFLYDESVRKKIRGQRKVSDATFVLTLVARFSRQKNHKKILSIFRILKSEFDGDFKLWLVGEGENFVTIKDEVSQDTSLKDDVVFWGMRNDIPNILSGSDFVVMPSYYEGLPYSIIEAQASGLIGLVSEEAFDESANITMELSYMSLAKSNSSWAKCIFDLKKKEQLISDEIYKEKRIRRNSIIKNSKYDVSVGANLVGVIYNK